MKFVSMSGKTGQITVPLECRGTESKTGFLLSDACPEAKQIRAEIGCPYPDTIWCCFEDYDPLETAPFAVETEEETEEETNKKKLAWIISDLESLAEMMKEANIHEEYWGLLYCKIQALEELDL